MFALLTYLCASNYTYNVVIDAGSNAKMYIFKVPYNETTNKIEKVYVSSSNKNTLADAYYDDRIIPAIFDPLLNESMHKIRDDMQDQTFDNWSQVLLFVAGTSAMRELDEDDRFEVQNKTVDYLKEKFNFTIMSVTTLSTSEEGVYTFIAVNTAMNATDKRYSVLGLSGGNNFVVTDESNGIFDLETVVINNVKVNTYIFTYPQYSTRQLINNYTMTMASIAGQANISSTCFLKGSEPDESAIIQVTGTGNYTNCNESISNYTLWFQPYFGFEQGYFFDKIQRPKLPSEAKFVATGDSYASNFAGLFDKLKGDIPEMADFENITIENFINATDKYCAMTLEEVKAKVTNIPDIYLAQDCLEMALQSRMLKYGYRMKDDQVMRLSEYDGLPLGWQLGLVAYFYSPTVHPVNAKLWLSVAIALLILLIIIIVICVIICKCVKKHKQEAAMQQNYVDPAAFDVLDE